MTQYKKLPGYDAPSPAADTSKITDINRSDVAVGDYSDGTKQYGYVARGGSSQPETIQIAGLSTILVGIDDAGDIVGDYFQDGAGGSSFARLADGKYVNLDNVVGPTTIADVSRSGEVTGTYGANNIFIAHLNANGFEQFKTVHLTDANGKNIQLSQASPSAVNDQGDVAGTYYVDNGPFLGFVEHDGTTTTLQAPGAKGTFVSGINNSGEVVGTFLDASGFQHGFTYTAADGFQQSDVPGATATTIAGINDAGQLTGTYYTGKATLGFVRTGNDVTTIDNGANFNPAAINDAGVVGGNLGNSEAAVFGPGKPAAYSIAASGDVAEGSPGGAGGTVTFTVTRDDSSSAGSVAVGLTGTATLGQDYTVSGLGQDDRISFAANEASKSFTVTSIPDSQVEDNETVVATLSSPSNPGETVAQASATARILNDDVAPPAGGGGGAAGGGNGNSGGGSTTPVTTQPVVTTTQPVTGTPTNNTAAPAVAFDPTVAVAPGDVVTLSGTYSAAAGIGSVVVTDGGVTLGTATLRPNGTWSLAVDFTSRPGSHTGLTATATDAKGQTGTAHSPYDLSTDWTKADTGGEPYRTVQDNLDPTTGAYTGSIYFNRDGSEYLGSQLTSGADGSSIYTYEGGTFFDDKTYVSFADHYAVDGTLTQHATTNANGVQVAAVHAGGQTLDAADPAATGGTRFVFSPHLGHETIVDFVTGGPGHDRIDLGHASSGFLASVLAHAHDDGAGNTVLSVGHGNTVTLADVAPGELTRRDFAIHA